MQPIQANCTDGYVQVDGKLVHSSVIEEYREGNSTRMRARSRGGSRVRCEASLLQVGRLCVETHVFCNVVVCHGVMAPTLHRLSS